MSRNGNDESGQRAADGDASGRFAELVELKVTGREFLSAADEVGLLEEGVRTYGLPLAQARGVVA